jgi:cytochrome c553
VKRLLLLPLLLLSCTKVALPPPPPPDLMPVAPPECTLDTPLVPGVPGSPYHLVPSSRNPNGASELALHMRAMEGELSAVRTALSTGAVRPMLRPRFAKIRCAWPTTPADRNPQFDRDALSYLEAVSQLDAAPPATAAAAYTGVLAACRACHERSCSGAIVAIEALKLPSSASLPPPR